MMISDGSEWKKWGKYDGEAYEGHCQNMVDSGDIEVARKGVLVIHTGQRVPMVSCTGCQKKSKLPHC